MVAIGTTGAFCVRFGAGCGLPMDDGLGYGIPMLDASPSDRPRRLVPIGEGDIKPCRFERLRLTL